MKKVTKRKKPLIDIDNFANAIITNSLYRQFAHMHVSALKKSTLTLVVKELLPSVLNDGVRFDNSDRRDFQLHKQAVIKAVVKQLLNVL